MIQIFRGQSGPGKSPLLDDMYQQRKHVFVNLLKWDLQILDGRFEVDQFDTDMAIYLIAADTDGRHLGSIRLLPTTGDHLLGTIFPQLSDGPVPSGPTVMEISRGCLSTSLRARERLAIRNRLTTAVVEYALASGVDQLTCIADAGWYSQILALGWDCRPLGLARRIAGSMTGALAIQVTPETPRLLHEAGTYDYTQLVPALQEVAA
ncbi:GNAT family N-acetyltransferase [Sphingobium yanoikuyae]|uniref:Acyl-homoserine-lactone synthase n=1 Tax=Sphingobium yanoikuyae TaxID=13690 RepID=A0AA42WZQ3_SPHYA|nr:acyl-homoserine-lactone synthase [Sphingobium yanoikuyae]MDH2134795.1 GNAT family N-acetyltransferase [Sphingobium yanoikuyae]MDH2152861.1 GNAT family N-acetyltransferase [Sphingobium yanoikuyae]MDH2170316.1 GNAT family N-acetyltransferase [Sphingobium yanoikuyae]